MKNFLISCLFFSALHLFGADSIGVVKSVENNAYVIRSEKQIPAKIGDRLFEKDILKTTSQSSIGVTFSDGSVLSLGPNSFILVDTYLFKPTAEQFNFQLDMKKGTAVFESGKISNLAPEAFAFKIPEGTIGIRGTKFLVNVK